MKRARYLISSRSAWGRFSRYEIRAGSFALLRELGSRSTTPGLHSWTSRLRDGGEDAKGGEKAPRPYELLFRAADELVRGRRSSGEELVCEWCSEYGLLGVLLHQFIRVDLAWRWDRLSPRSPRVLVPVQVSYRRIGGNWKRGEIYADDHQRRPSETIRRGHLVKVPKGDKWSKGGHVSYAFHPGPDRRRLDERWRRFFPEVRKPRRLRSPTPSPPRRSSGMHTPNLSRTSLE